MTQTPIISDNRDSQIHQLQYWLIQMIVPFGVKATLVSHKGQDDDVETLSLQ